MCSCLDIGLFGQGECLAFGGMRIAVHRTENKTGLGKNMELILSTLINGLSLGGIYAMIALGYTMVYGIAKMLNFAHGDVIMVGAYAVLSTLTLTGHPILGVVVAVVICTVLGVVMEKVAYKPLRGASPRR